MNYNEFRLEYENQHPASVPRMEVEMHEYQAWTWWAVLATFICAAMVSGVHTVPTVWKSIELSEVVTPVMRNIVSFASLLAIELAILLSAYLMAKGVKLAYGVMAMAATIAIGANLYSVIAALNAGGDIGALLVAIFLGIGMPFIALFTGKMFVDIHRADRVQDARAKKAFTEASVIWDKEIERSWKAYQRTGGVSRNFMKSGEVEEVHEVSRTVHEAPKPRVKLHEVAREIHEAGDSKLSAAEMMAKYQIGLGSTTKVREILTTNGFASKGDE